MNLTFEAVLEDSPGSEWRTAFRRHWPGWKAWYLGGRTADTPSLRQSEQALNRHMPEFAPIWQRLVGLAGNDEDAARFLTFWYPPAYLAQCSQAVLVDHERPVLVRNYDLDPALNEATILNSAWNGRRVIGSMEAIAGLADGINDRGLALSIAFGGRQVVGPGFGIPLITRYVLEICGDSEEAVEVLRRVPSHQSYNVANRKAGLRNSISPANAWSARNVGCLRQNHSQHRGRAVSPRPATTVRATTPTDGEHRTCNNRTTIRFSFIVRPSLCIRMTQNIIIASITNSPERGTSIGDLTRDRIKKADSISQAAAARRRAGYA